MLGIESAWQLTTHPLRGALFESWVVAEYLKQRLNTARPSNLSFWRDRSGHEIDLLIEQGGVLQPVEIKSGATVRREALSGLFKWQGISGQSEPRPRLVYGGDETQHRSDVDVVGWKSLACTPQPNFPSR